MESLPIELVVLSACSRAMFSNQYGGQLENGVGGETTTGTADDSHQIRRTAYLRYMWEYALWGLAGAAVNRALVFLEANRRVKGPAWRYPEGPGGGYYALATILHCGIGSIVTYAAATSHIVSSPLIALGLGSGAPVVMAKIGRYALAALPRTEPDQEAPEDVN
ncbi:hypothetical protein J5X84_33510 [Streptosporangiaceae bacterium NEAU-GS5]|nr:hypothetical protein [Streptosporangiaceae bacterium NEAU-GS5]